MKQYPPPWKLKGKGYILLYRFSKSIRAKQLSKQSLFFPTFMEQSKIFGFGTTMIVDYQQSDAGPYQELLFIPGKYDSPAGKYYAITKIYVSTQESIINGRANWAIPKEQAVFSFTKAVQQPGEIVEVFASDSLSGTQNNESKPFFRMHVQDFGPKFPIFTTFLNLVLRQHGLEDSMYYYTKLIAKGKARLTRVLSLQIDPRFFPDTTQIKPLLAISIPDFQMEFPVPQIKTK